MLIVPIDDKFEVDKMKRLLINDFNSPQDLATYRCDYNVDGVNIAIVEYQVYDENQVVTVSPNGQFLK